MKSNYSYTFVRVNDRSSSKDIENKEYQKIIQEHTQQGWRFVQVFAPPIGVYGVAPYYDLIFERASES